MDLFILNNEIFRDKVLELNSISPFLKTYKGVYLQCIINKYKDNKIIRSMFFESSSIDDFFNKFEELERDFEVKYPIWDQVILFAQVNMLVDYFNGIGLSSYELNGYLYIHLGCGQKTTFNVLDVFLNIENYEGEKTFVLKIDKVDFFKFLTNIKYFYLTKNFNNLSFTAKNFMGQKKSFRCGAEA